MSTVVRSSIDAKPAHERSAAYKIAPVVHPNGDRENSGRMRRRGAGGPGPARRASRVLLAVGTLPRVAIRYNYKYLKSTFLAGGSVIAARAGSCGKTGGHDDGRYRTG